MWQSDITDLALLEGEESEKKLLALLDEAKDYNEGLVKANEGIDAKSNVLFSFITALILFLLKETVDEYVTHTYSLLFWVYVGLLTYYSLAACVLTQNLLTSATGITGREPSLTLSIKNLERNLGVMLYHQLHSLQHTIDVNKVLNRQKANRLRWCMRMLLLTPSIALLILVFRHF